MTKQRIDRAGVMPMRGEHGVELSLGKLAGYDELPGSRNGSREHLKETRKVSHADTSTLEHVGRTFASHHGHVIVNNRPTWEAAPTCVGCGTASVNDWPSAVCTETTARMSERESPALRTVSKMRT